MDYLTKSAFAQSVSCHTKLYYLSNNYPSTASDNEYLKFLAQGGFMVGALAQAKYPEGIFAPKSEDSNADAEHTKELILKGDVTLFEAPVIEGRKLSIADILQRKGNTLNLIEVKSKSIDTKVKPIADTLRTKKGEIRTEWLEYLYDLTFQYALVQKTFTHFTVNPYLLLVDTSKKCNVDALPSYFSIEVDSFGQNPKVVTDPNATSIITTVDLLSLIDVTAEVKQLLPKVLDQMQILEESFIQNKKIPSKLAIKCKDCEYKSDAFDPNGYDECWKGIPKEKEHIFDLYYGTVLKHEGQLVLDSLIDQKKTSLFNIPLDVLSGKRGERQHLQIEKTKANKEWIDPALKRIVNEVSYPLHFIDFETTRTAIPFHAGMRPFEQIAFQFSCHTVESPNSQPIHSEWINIEPKFPNFEFAKALMNTLSPNGTVFVWATHEGSVLSEILEQMEVYGHKDPELKEFLQKMDAIKLSQDKFIDMNKLTGEYYFHPEMKGKTSIKKVFPAIWKSNPDIRKLPWFAPYEVIEGGQVMDPYKNLPPMVISRCDVSVQEGTAAMRAYEEMIFGQASKRPEEKEQWKKLLLQYCKLDTLAMVVIWERWRNSP